MTVPHYDQEEYSRGGRKVFNEYPGVEVAAEVDVVEEVEEEDDEQPEEVEDEEIEDDDDIVEVNPEDERRRVAMVDECKIVYVWGHNLYHEFDRLERLLVRYNYIFLVK